MTFKMHLASAVLCRVDGAVLNEIAGAVVDKARAGDYDAIRLLTALAESLPEMSCDHPADHRENITTMGGGPIRERCACGTLLEDGEPVSEAGVAKE